MDTALELVMPIAFGILILASIGAYRDLKRRPGEERPTLSDVLNHKYWLRSQYIVYPLGVSWLFMLAISASRDGNLVLVLFGGAAVVLATWAAIIEFNRRYKVKKRSSVEREEG